MVALLEKFFTGIPSGNGVQQAIAAIERSGYQMEFRTEFLEQMIDDPFTHP